MFCDLVCRAARSKSTTSQIRHALPPTFGKDHFISLVCGNLNGQLYVGKLDVSKRSVGKCVLSSGKWCTPPEFEVLGGKKARKWKQSLMHLGKPLCDYDLGLSPDNISSLLIHLLLQLSHCLQHHLLVVLAPCLQPQTGNLSVLVILL